MGVQFASFHLRIRSSICDEMAKRKMWIRQPKLSRNCSSWIAYIRSQRGIEFQVLSFFIGDGMIDVMTTFRSMTISSRSVSFCINNEGGSSFSYTSKLPRPPNRTPAHDDGLDTYGKRAINLCKRAADCLVVLN